MAEGLCLPSGIEKTYLKAYAYGSVGGTVLRPYLEFVDCFCCF